MKTKVNSRGKLNEKKTNLCLTRYNIRASHLSTQHLMESLFVCLWYICASRILSGDLIEKEKNRQYRPKKSQGTRSKTGLYARFIQRFQHVRFCPLKRRCSALRFYSYRRLTGADHRLLCLIICIRHTRRPRK